MPTHPSMANADLVADVERFVQEMAAELDVVPDDGPPGPGGPRILPELVLWAGMLVCVLRGWSSQRALWRLLSLKGLWSHPRIPVSDQAIYTRLAQGGTAPLEQVFHQVSAVLDERLAAWPVLGASDLASFARAVVAIDETTLDPVARSLPSLRGTSGKARLPGKLAGVFDLRAQQWRTVRLISDPHQNEKVLARELAATLPAGSLILADLGYFGFEWFDNLTDAGFHWVSRTRVNTTHEVLHPFYHRGDTRDELIWLGAYRADKAKHAVRRVQFAVGDTVHCYLTNVTDPTVLPAIELARLYARRWDIELAVKLVKRELGLHLLWSAKPTVVWQQVWAVLIIAQIVQALRLEVAGRAGVDPFEVSLPLLVQYLPLLAAAGEDPIAVLVAQGRQVEIIRPSRRTRIQGPAIDVAELAMPPPDLVRSRTPRYARRRGGPTGRLLPLSTN